MNANKPSRFLKLIGCVFAFPALVYIGIVAIALSDFRVHTYTIHSRFDELLDDDSALRLARSALRLHGVDPGEYAPCIYDGDVSVGRNSHKSDRVTTLWISNSPGKHGFGVSLEQHGSDVGCFVSRLK